MMRDPLQPVAERSVDGERTLTLWRYLFNWRLQLTIATPIEPLRVVGEWCFSDAASGIEAVNTWDCRSENPPGYLKNASTGQMNPNHPSVKEREAWNTFGS